MRKNNTENNTNSQSRFLKLMTALAGLVVLSACSSGIIGNASYTADGKHEMSTSIQNPILGMRIEINDIITARTNEFLVADIRFKNKWGFSQDFKYRIHWYDVDGMEIKPDNPSWANIVLTGKSERTVKVTSPTTSATHLKVFVRD